MYTFIQISQKHYYAVFGVITWFAMCVYANKGNPGVYHIFQILYSELRPNMQKLILDMKMYPRNNHLHFG